MIELDHFSHGWVTPVLAYVMSVIGSVLALRCATHARTSRRQGPWLIAAAVSLGGAGIWVMHFTAMLGFAIQDVTIRYNVPVTLLSAAIAIAVVWVGLSIVVRWQRETIALPLGGLVTGLGVAAMHYLGMHAMHAGAHIEYNAALVALSLLIAVVAATAALWFVLHVRGYVAATGAALIMGVAVCGMHYTGMAAMSAHRMDAPPEPSGVDSVELVTPLVLVVTLVMIALIVLVGLAELGSPDSEEFDSSTVDPELAESGRSWPRAAPPATRRTGNEATAPPASIPSAVSLQAMSEQQAAGRTPSAIRTAEPR